MGFPSVKIVQGMRDRYECMRVRPLLQPFLDGELDGAQQERLVAHLQACQRCGLAASTYRALIDRLHGLERPVDADAVARLEEFVDDLDDSADKGRPGDPAG